MTITKTTVPAGEDTLFEQIDADGSERCTVCGSVNSAQYDSAASFYAGHDHYATCGICGSSERTADPFQGTNVIERRENKLLLIPHGDTTLRLFARGGFLYPAVDDHDEANYETDPATVADVKVGDRVAVTDVVRSLVRTFTVTEVARDQWGMRFWGQSWDDGEPKPFASTVNHRVSRAG